MKKTISLLFILFILLSQIPSLSAEKEIQIGYSYKWGGISFHFNVPLTNEMIQVINKQEGVASLSINPRDKYEMTVEIGKMFSPGDVAHNIIRALEAEIFSGKIVKNRMLK